MGDPKADTKFRKTKKIGKGEIGDDSAKEEDTYNFYGDYDLTSYFENTNENQNKNLCLCVSHKK